MSKIGDKFRRFWDEAEGLMQRELARTVEGQKEPPLEAEARARTLDGKPLTLSVRQVHNIHHRLDSEITTPMEEAQMLDVRVEVIHAIQAGRIFANLPKNIRTIGPETLEGESIEVHERWAGKQWKGPL